MLTVRHATPADAARLSEVATETFPLACPPGSTVADIAIFLADTLSQQCFHDYTTDPDRIVLAAETEGTIIGYALLGTAEPADPDVRAAVESRPVAELSKMYVLPGHHGAGVAAALMRAALDTARELGVQGVWLGVNQENVRAQRFYAKNGFRVVGTKTFTVGSQLHDDFVMELRFRADENGTGSAGIEA